MDSIYTQQNPQVILRSKLISLNTACYFMCNLSYTITYRWKLTYINSTSNKDIDLSSNPTWQSTILVIQANTLVYGLYSFNFQTNVSISSNNVLLTNNITTYVQIVSTGLAVYGLQNGINGLSIGTQQTLNLNPALYSFDMDNLIQPSSLQFKFFCYTITAGSNIAVNTSQSIDLLTYKNNSQLQINRNTTCFSSSGNLFYSFFLKSKYRFYIFFIH